MDPRHVKAPFQRSMISACLEPRYQICFCCFLATLVAYVERTGFSIAYTAMCEQDGVNEKVKGTVMSAFYWGYGLSQIPGSWLAQRHGGRLMLIISFACWSTVCILMPTTARHTVGMAAGRVLIGISQGLLIPSVHTVLSEWILPHERAKATSLTTSGMYLGSAGAMQFLPALAKVHSPGFVLKVVSALGYIWLVLWLLVGREAKQRTGYIPMSYADGLKARQINGDPRRTSSTPWSRLLSHPAIWAIVVNNFTFHYSFYVIMNWLPTYFSAVIGTDLSTIGIGKPLPYIVMFIMSNVGGWTGDIFIQKSYSVASARKIVNAMGFWGTATFLLLMPSAGSVSEGIFLVSCCLGCCGFARGGFSVNHMDIAPRYAGIVMGISNTAGTVSGIIGVALTGFILENAGGSMSRVGWIQGYALAALMGSAGSLLFIWKARGDRLFN